MSAQQYIANITEQRKCTNANSSDV